MWAAHQCSDKVGVKIWNHKTDPYGRGHSPAFHSRDRLYITGGHHCLPKTTPWTEMKIKGPNWNQLEEGCAILVCSAQCPLTRATSVLITATRSLGTSASHLLSWNENVKKNFMSKISGTVPRQRPFRNVNFIMFKSNNINLFIKMYFREQWELHLYFHNLLNSTFCRMCLLIPCKNRNISVILTNSVTLTSLEEMCK